MQKIIKIIKHIFFADQFSALVFAPQFYAHKLVIQNQSEKNVAV